ncbi:PilT/PilU family type 4a pilus ATPase [Pseudohongiella sp.]|uniref:AAA+ ATPase domain-containing protein n=1 Tax=marine sediment metagenome TaxID=412755 RepID=A0A0F9Z102_9ZZZZ|nr:PilT/PilU family type 4a pilus ATPase [Pseudohongiella sp.]HDZ08428.1 PilT/PilU family type 4a pilus ATPase [Pseudohongiella sp.]HEA62793.1 PilT/PilU family type 4a pilus ATPase [Pseudohongiella sp.]
MLFKDMLKAMVAQEASDLFLTADAAPMIKTFGHIKALDDHPLSGDDVQATAFAIMSPDQQQQFTHEPELNLAIAEPGIGRFRANVFRQRGQLAMVVRHVKTEIPQPEALGLPDILQQLIMEKRGLLLFVGATGSGKSTSLAALIDYRNRNSDGHIITVEDPIEFIHPHKKSIISQREVGLDTVSYGAALKNTLRQAPDVILIGEIRSMDTMEHALAFAETGHLCVSTLHANNANQALDRIINFFPEERHKQLFLDLSLNLRGLVSQRLIPSSDGKRAAAFEILLGTPRVCDLIKQGKIDDIRETMEKSAEQGMVTFDAALLSLYQAGRITLDDALKNADSKNNLRLKIQLSDGSSSTADADNSSLTLRPKD